MMGKIRLLVFTVLLAVGSFIIDHGDIVLSPFTENKVEKFDVLNVQSNNYSTYGEFVGVLFDNCWTDKHLRVIIDRYVGFRQLKFKSGGKIIIDPLNTCRYEYNTSYINVLTISDSNKEDFRNINLLDSESSIYNKLMFHYMNYGARPVYSQRPDKAILKIEIN